MQFSGRVAELIVEKGGTRRMNRLQDVQRTAHTQGGDASRLNSTCDQSHGLMTHGSDRDQKSHIDLFSPQLFGQSRGQFIPHFSRRINSTHESKSVVSQFTDHALFF